MPDISGDLNPVRRARAQRMAVLQVLTTTEEGKAFLHRIADDDDPAWRTLSERWCSDIPF